MKNITKLTEDLRSFFHISEETIHSILEANISHSKVQGCFHHKGLLTAAAALTIFPCLLPFHSWWGGMDIHTNDVAEIRGAQANKQGTEGCEHLVI